MGKVDVLSMNSLSDILDYEIGSVDYTCCADIIKIT